MKTRQSVPPTKETPRPVIANPVLRGMHPDPTVCRVGETIYLATSSFGLFPGVPLYASEDLVQWRFVRHILSRPSQLPFHAEQSTIGAGIFAPTLRHDGSRFYLVTTNQQNGGNFIVSATDPAGEWSDPVWIEEAYQGGIDPSITFLEDGRVLYQVTADTERGDKKGLTQFELDLKTGKGLSPRKFLSDGCGWKAVEGPHLFQKGPYWYLLTAEGGTETNHRVAIARGDSPWGPWTPCPWNPILTHSGIEARIQSTGHADLFDDASGRWWIAFLGVRHAGYPPVHLSGRNTYMAPVEWSEDGWPIVNNRRPVELEPESEVPVWEERFDKPALNHKWVTLGPSYDKVYRLSDDGGLHLNAVADSLSRSGPKGFVGTRLDANLRRYETTLVPGPAGSETGLAVFMETKGYYALGLRPAANDRTEILFTRRVLDMESTKRITVRTAEQYRLRVDLLRGDSPWTHKHNEFVFSIQNAPGGEWTEAGRGTCRLISTELIGGFGGLLVGPYCCGDDPTATAEVRSFLATLPE